MVQRIEIEKVGIYVEIISKDKSLKCMKTWNKEPSKVESREIISLFSSLIQCHNILIQSSPFFLWENVIFKDRKSFKFATSILNYGWVTWEIA